jgi:serine/threonine-protein kinase
MLSAALLGLVLVGLQPAVAASANPVARTPEAVAGFAVQSGQVRMARPCNPCDGTIIFTDVATGRCLDSNSSGSAYTLACNGGNYQRWRPQVVGGTLFVDVATGRCLKAPAQGGASTAGCNSSDNDQIWAGAFTSNPDNIVRIFGGQCLDSNSQGNVYTLPCNGGQFQLWYR